MLPDAQCVAIALRGAKGAGKSAVARALSRKLGWPLVVTGDVVRRWALSASGSADALAVQRAAGEARQTAEGVMGQIIHTLWPGSAPPCRIVVDSVREPTDIASLRGLGYLVVLVTVSASFELRLARVRKRGRSDDTRSSSGLRAHDRWERSLGSARTRGDISVGVMSDQMDKLLTRLFRKLRRTGVINA